MIQLQALNKILREKDTSFLTLNNIDESFFSDYINEYRYIKKHIDMYHNVPDMETFISVFPDFDVIAVNESSDYILDALFEDKNKRYLANTFNKIRNLLNAGKTDEATQLYLTSQSNLSKVATHIKSVDILSDTSRYESYIQKTQNFNNFYVKTGFDELDDVIGGWDRQEELATIVARTNQGKSWILLKTALAAAQQGLTVGLYSGEMSENKVGFRIDSLISHISNTKIIHGNVSVQNEYKEYLDNLDKIPGKIKVITPVMVGGPVGVNALKAFIEREHLDMLCIDQHSLLEDDRKAKNPVERASNISRDLKNLQVMEKIPIISVSQQNRTATEDGATTVNIAQSDRIGQDSTTILFLDQKDGVMTIELGKSRDSANGLKLKYSINLDKGTFEYVPNEKDALEGSKCEDIRKEYDADVNDGGDVF